MAMWKCLKCGWSNTDKGQTCAKCGWPQLGEEAERQAWEANQAAQPAPDYDGQQLKALNSINGKLNFFTILVIVGLLLQFLNWLTQ